MEYPNPEHQRANARAYRRAGIALDTLTTHSSDLRRRLAGSDQVLIDPGDADRFQEQVSKLRTALTEISVLRDVRDKAEAAAGDRED